ISVYHRGLVLIIFLFGFLFSAQQSFAQLPEVKTSVDKNKILIGEQLHLKVATSMPDNTFRLSWFDVPDTLGSFVVIKKDKIDSTNPNGNLNFSQVITLTSFDSGIRVIPRLILNGEPLQGDTSFNLLTDSIPIDVAFSPMDSTKTFHDIKNIIEVKKEWPWWLWAIIGVAILLLIFWIRFLIKFLKKKPAPPDFFTARLSPYDEAMQSLTELEKQQLLQKNEPDSYRVKEFHFRLNEIFKRYISRVSKTYKMHFTSDELLMDLDEYHLRKEQLFAFANCLRMSSAVKFAKYIPPDSDSEKCLQQTKEMITEINNLNKETTK
ncbi:MAG: hypothetical protein ACRDE5_16760, partial [Ginsengibacter sp.]